MFLWLFRLTEFDGQTPVPNEVNLLFRLDPFAAATAMLAGKTFLWIFWPSLVVLGLTFLLGRFFCGWICPLGTLLDILDRLLGRLAGRFQSASITVEHRLRAIPLALLTASLAAAALGFQFAGYLDPFSVLIRELTVAVDPVLSRGAAAFFDVLRKDGPSWLAAVSGPVHDWLRTHFLAFEPKPYVLAGVSFSLLAIVFALEIFSRRFWCRSLCPLGGLLGIAGRFSLLKRLSVKACDPCLICASTCRMGAFDEKKQFLPQSCNLCMDCIGLCPQEMITFRFQAKKRQVPFDLSRRAFLGSVAAGAVSAMAPAIIRSETPDGVLRPPGARSPETFSQFCIRCGECMKICPTAALQPSFLEGGINGVFSPRFIPRTGYCEYNCNLCGQLCPTGAIKPLSVPLKQKTVIGKASFDTSRCLPYDTGETCLVCEEHCPIPEKAIHLDDVKMLNRFGKRVVARQPYVINDLCIGCGTCENKCPLEGEAAVHVHPLI